MSLHCLGQYKLSSTIQLIRHLVYRTLHPPPPICRYHQYKYIHSSITVSSSNNKNNATQPHLAVSSEQQHYNNLITNTTQLTNEIKLFLLNYSTTSPPPHHHLNDNNTNKKEIKLLSPQELYTTFMPRKLTSEFFTQYNVKPSKAYQHLGILQYLHDTYSTIQSHPLVRDIIDLCIHYDEYKQLGTEQQQQHIIKIYKFCQSYEIYRLNHDTLMNKQNKTVDNHSRYINILHHRYQQKIDLVNNTTDIKQLCQLYKSSWSHRCIKLILPLWLKTHLLSSSRRLWLQSIHYTYEDSTKLFESLRKDKQNVLNAKLTELQHKLEYSSSLTLRDKFKLMSQQRQLKTTYETWHKKHYNTIQNKLLQYQQQQHKQQIQSKFDSIQQYTSTYILHHINANQVLIDDIIQLVKLLSTHTINTYQYVQQNDNINYVSVIYCNSKHDMKLCIDSIQRLLNSMNIIDITTNQIQIVKNQLNQLYDIYPVDLYELPPQRQCRTTGGHSHQHSTIRLYSQSSRSHNINRSNDELEQYYVVQLHNNLQLHIYSSIDTDSAAIQYDTDGRYMNGELCDSNEIYQQPVTQCQIAVHC